METNNWSINWQNFNIFSEPLFSNSLKLNIETHNEFNYNPASSYKFIHNNIKETFTVNYSQLNSGQRFQSWCWNQKE